MIIYENLNMIRLLTIILGAYYSSSMTTIQALSETSGVLKFAIKVARESSSSSSMSNRKSESGNAAGFN